MHRYSSKNNTNNTNTNRNEQAKIYFPSIPIQVLQHALHGAQAQKQNKRNRNTKRYDNLGRTSKEMQV